MFRTIKKSIVYRNMEFANVKKRCDKYVEINRFFIEASFTKLIVVKFRKIRSIESIIRGKL